MIEKSLIFFWNLTVYCHKYCRKLLFVWKQKQAKKLSWRFCLQNEKAHNALVNFPLTSLILRDPPCKYGNIRFTTELFIALSEHVSIRYTCFKFWQLFIFICGLYAFLHYKKKNELITFRVRKTILSSTFLIRLRFEGYSRKSDIVNFA